MAGVAQQLHAAAEAGDVAALKAALTAGADPNASLPRPGTRHSWAALHRACERGHLACVLELLAAGADMNILDSGAWTPLHCAARGSGDGHVQCVGALLAAGADPCLTSDGSTLGAAICGRVENIRALLAAAPQLALMPCRDGKLPLWAALDLERADALRCLLEHGPLPSGLELFDIVDAAVREQRSRGRLWGRELYALVAARQPLTPVNWARLPFSSAGLRDVLPAVLARSETEASLLLMRLSSESRERLRTAALCLRRTERVHGLDLPVDIVRRLLPAAVEESLTTLEPVTLPNLLRHYVRLRERNV